MAEGCRQRHPTDLANLGLRIPSQLKEIRNVRGIASPRTPFMRRRRRRLCGIVNHAVLRKKSAE